jgi:hypothetical protein
MLSPWRLKLVERLADRWSVTHDELFTLRFEFDSEQGMTLRDPAESAQSGRALPRSDDGGSADRRGDSSTDRPTKI